MGRRHVASKYKLSAAAPTTYPLEPKLSSGTPRRTIGSYFNAIFAIMLYGVLAKWAWNTGQDYIGGFLSSTASVVFGFLCMLQVFGIVMEYLGNDDVCNPWTGEWTRVE
jgi:hypothetical protein